MGFGIDDSIAAANSVCGDVEGLDVAGVVQRGEGLRTSPFAVAIGAATVGTHPNVVFGYRIKTVNEKEGVFAGGIQPLRRCSDVVIRSSVSRGDV